MYDKNETRLVRDIQQLRDRVDRLERMLLALGKQVFPHGWEERDSSLPGQRGIDGGTRDR